MVAFTYSNAFISYSLTDVVTVCGGFTFIQRKKYKARLHYTYECNGLYSRSESYRARIKRTKRMKRIKRIKKMKRIKRIKRVKK